MKDDNSDLLMGLIRDISLKIDGIVERQVTRYEFQELHQRLDKLVVKSEFEQYKTYVEQQTTARHSAFQSQLDNISGKLPTGKLPAWLMQLIIAVLAACVGGLAGGYSGHYYYSHSEQPAYVQHFTSTTRLGH
ncbi:MAG: hypothetical protein ACYDEW_00600 [Vulcanimicrobiaceae bacterium]